MDKSHREYITESVKYFSFLLQPRNKTVIYGKYLTTGIITLVDEFLNKREIRDKKPSVYMRNFQRQNPDLARAMRTHLISLDDFGVWDDDYERFLDRRCAAFARELSSKVIRRDIDDRGQVPIFDDFEEIEVAEREMVETT